MTQLSYFADGNASVEDDIANDFGIGSLYWMESVMVRKVRDWDSDKVFKILSVLRISNPAICDLGAVVEFDFSVGGIGVTGRFLGLKFIPGLSISHPSIVYDEVTELYWMISHSYRSLSALVLGKRRRGNRQMSKVPCESDRSTLALYFSPDALSWHFGTILANFDFHGHVTYPQMIIYGDSIVFVCRATVYPEGMKVDPYYNNHNSNSITYHNISGFRKLVDNSWQVSKSKS